MANLITYEEIGALSRPCSTDRDIAEALVAEAQRLDIRPRIGDELYVNLISHNYQDERLIKLLEGTQWHDGCEVRCLTGLKTALAYYAMARITRDGNITPTTYGAVIKDDQYSQEAERSERQRYYRELFSIADSYMAEVIEFLNRNCSLYPEYKKRKIKNNRTSIRIIGK